MIRIFITLLIITVAGSLHAQGIVLKRGNTTTPVEKDNFLEIYTGDCVYGGEKCCSYKKIDGFVTGMEGDKIKLQVQQVESYAILEDWASANHFTVEGASIMLLDQDEIIHLKKHASYKHMKNKEILGSTAAGLILTGLVTAAGALIVKKDSRKNLLFAGGIQVGTGLILGATIGSAHKNYVFKADDGDLYRFHNQQ